MTRTTLTATTVGPTAAHHRHALIEQAKRAASTRDLFAVASARMRRLVPFAAAAWLAVDPVTGLPTAPVRLENVDPNDCLRAWELELLGEDTNPFRKLAPSGLPAASLRRATRDCPARSARYRELLAPRGFDDELRAVLGADGRPWATLTLLRRGDEPAFGAREIELVGSLSRPLGETLREQVLRPVPAEIAVRARGPGLILLGPGAPLSANEDALALLDELRHDHAPEAGGPELPLGVATTAVRAQAIAGQRDRGAARVRIRSRAGRWLACHATCLRDPGGAIVATAVVIEPAGAAEMASIILEASAVSRRERQIIHLLAQGLGTTDVADELKLSPHTVRDYLKAVFEKMGVSTRGQLVAKVFSERHEPVSLEPIAA